MKTSLSRKDITQELVDAVAGYVYAQAKATVTREAVDEAAREILAADPLPHRRGGDPITDPKLTYLATDEASERYFDLMDAKLRELGLKPDDMPRDYCPALVAEADQHNAEVAVITEAARMLEIDEPLAMNNDLLCQKDGLAKRQKFIDLTVRLVVSAGFVTV